jgi:phage baseplate assembly protein W|tara:strand:+ start:597 stop:1016 length:420 start_codon:yes stop_codon:yes gene_type:complete
MAQFNSKNQSSRVSRRWFSDIDVNMTLHPQSGDLVLKYDINAIKRSIKNLLTTNLYERPFKPSLGINLSGMLFELSTMGTDGIVLEQDIIRMINTYEPRANVTDVFSSMNGTNLDVSLMLTISNDPRPQELNVTLQRIR